MNLPSPSSQTHPSGFTLIEVLAVTMILGILMALIVPAIGRAQQSARATESLSNLRNIGQALLLFANDNNQHLPKLTDTSETYSFDAPYWPTRIQPYLPPPTVTKIDINNKKIEISSSLISPLLPNGRHHSLGDYGANRFLIRHGPPGPISLASIPNPQKLVTVVAAEIRNRALPNGSWYIESSLYILNPSGASLAPSTHGAKHIPALFADGHVEQFLPVEFESRREELLKFNP